MKEKVITQTNMSEKVIDKVFVVSKNKFHPEEERYPTSHTIMRVDRLLSMLLIISGKGAVTGKERPGVSHCVL
ncbi:hypothetical protein AMQ83_14885 [Paenibacillus riograndensis]|nr:hypothetical protein AMQ83_14885 [Paenibacillus riograndensis]